MSYEGDVAIESQFLQVSCLSFAGTLSLLEPLFCPFLEFHASLTTRLRLTCSEKRRPYMYMYVMFVKVSYVVSLQH